MKRDVTRTGRLSRRRLLRATAGLGLAGTAPVALNGCWSGGPSKRPMTMPRIGLAGGNPADPLFREVLGGLQDFGWVDGRSATVLVPEPDLIPGQVRDLLSNGVDVLIAMIDQATQVAKEATSSVPIIMAGSAAPVELGFVASLARPGENVTGTSMQAPELSAKRLEVLTEVVPGVRRVAVLWQTDVPAAPFILAETEKFAQAADVTLRPIEVRITGVSSIVIDSREVPQPPKTPTEVLNQAIPDETEALLMLPGPVLRNGSQGISQVAIVRRLSTMFPHRLGPEMGGLLGHNADQAAVYRRAAWYVDRVLRGARPADLPVEQPTKFEFVINMRTADALDLTIPSSVLALATEVIR